MEEDTEIHPHGIMGDFVHKYKTLIRPALEEGNFQGAAAVIGDVRARFTFVESSSIPIKKGAYAPYRMALSYLRGIANNSEGLTTRTLETMLPLIDRQVEELGLILMRDEHFERSRQRKKDYPRKP